MSVRYDKLWSKMKIKGPTEIKNKYIEMLDQATKDFDRGSRGV